MSWKVGLQASVYQQIEGVVRVPHGKIVDYVSVMGGGALEVGYLENGQRQVDMYFAPGSWLWAKRVD